MITYQVQPEHTFPHFSYKHLGLSRQTQRVNGTTGTVRVDWDQPSAQVEIKLDMSQVDTGVKVFNDELAEEQYFDVAHHPHATFRSTRVRFADGKPTTVEGEFTLKGITKPLTLHVDAFARVADHPLAHKDSIGVHATGKLKRSDFGLGAYVPVVGDEVTLDIVLEAIAA